MFVGITNSPRDYAWGSTTAIAELLGRQPSGAPEAELWLGTHPGSPARLVDGAATHGKTTLAELTTLPFLLKILAAASPLSLQVHPSIEQAEAGFEGEETAGVPIDAPHRTYKDRMHKPELLFALSEPFRALCGFVPASVSHERIERLAAAAVDRTVFDAWAARIESDTSIASTVEWLLSRGDGVAELIDAVVSTAPAVHGPEFAVVGELAKAYPGDPGVAISLMLNLVSLHRGDVLYLPAGNIHAYIEGLGIELMAASDNVLRGGLTPKHVDVPELISVLDATPLPIPVLTPIPESENVQAFRPPVRDFALVVVRGDARHQLRGPAILLCTDGEFTVTGVSGDGARVASGDAVFVSENESALDIRGSGLLFVATTGD